MATQTSEVQIYATGLCAASACAPVDVGGEAVAAAVNVQHPTGIASRWAIADDDFATGEPNPSPCNYDPNRRHWLLHC